MMRITPSHLPHSPPPTIIQPRVKHVTILALCLLAHGALGQQQSDSKREPAQRQDDLDVTMQIIMDPDAKLPDDVVRRIPLPERKPVESTRPNTDQQAEQRADRAAAAEARESAKEAKDLAKQEAAEQREQARRARAEERERNRPPKNPHPPGRPPRD